MYFFFNPRCCCCCCWTRKKSANGRWQHNEFWYYERNVLSNVTRSRCLWPSSIFCWQGPCDIEHTLNVHATFQQIRRPLLLSRLLRWLINHAGGHVAYTFYTNYLRSLLGMTEDEKNKRKRKRIDTNNNRSGRKQFISLSMTEA